MMDECGYNCKGFFPPRSLLTHWNILCCQISALKCGFLPVSQESVLIGEVSYHDYYGILVDPEERESIARNLGPLNKVCQGACILPTLPGHGSNTGLLFL